MADGVEIRVAGQRFEGWTSMAAEVGLDALAGSFNLGMTERWPGHPEDWAIPAGAPCEFYLGGEKLMTAYLDKAGYNMTAQDHPLEINGREKTADLIDCSAVHIPGTWSNRKMEDIAAEICAPFQIGVTAEGSTGEAFAKFSIQPGETAFAAIERMAKVRALLMTTSADGDLVLRRPGGKPGGYSLALGVNIETVGFKNDNTERYSDYIVKGTASGKDGPAARPKATARDPGCPRYRPLVIVDGEPATQAGLQKRALWEASVRAAKAQEVEVTVVGWRPSEGAPLYRPDTLVTVQARMVGADEPLLVSKVRYLLSGDQGRQTVLTLTGRNAFQPEPVDEPAVKSKGAAPLIKR